MWCLLSVVIAGKTYFEPDLAAATFTGIAAIAVLNNGLVHARQPREVAGMLTGALLLLALTASVLAKKSRKAIR